VVVEGGWEAAVDAALADPSSVVVTRAGDRMGPTGWRLAGAGASVAAALADARRTAESAAAAAAEAAAVEASARGAVDAAKARHADATVVLAHARARTAEP